MGGPSKCPNYFWHHQESSWPIMTTLWPIPLSEYFKTFIPFNVQRKKEDAWSAPIHAVWPSVSSSHHLCEHSPCYLCLLTTRCELLLNPIQLNAQHLAHLALTLKHLGCNFYSNTIQNDTSFLSNFPFRTSNYSSNYTGLLFSTFFAPQNFSSIVSIWCEYTMSKYSRWQNTTNFIQVL